MIRINIAELRDLILNGISTSELNSKYNYSSITDMSRMFFNCSLLETVPLLNTFNVTNTNGMFVGCSSLKSVQLFDTSNVTDMRYMFEGCNSLIQVDFKNCAIIQHIELLRY